MTGPSPNGRPDFSVLAVCTGNICRSPALELRLRGALGAGAEVAVSSAGVRALEGAPIDPTMAGLLGEVPDGFRGRQLGPGLVRSADLVLTMTTEQRRAVVASAPAAVRRVFTLREFAELAHLAGAAGVTEGAASTGRALQELVRAAPRFRAQRTAGDDDIEDPYGRDAAVFGRVLDAIDDAVRQITAVLPVAASGRVGRRPGRPVDSFISPARVMTAGSRR
jgi:protein-tyrosine phosphatase